MKLLDLGHLCIFTILVACDSGQTLAPLPSITGDSSCDEEAVTFSGGDLNAMMDRIFVGTVNKVNFVEDGLSDNCDPRLYEWTLRVELTVDENLKGSGDTAVVLVNPHKLQWSSIPLLKRDGDWLPSTGRPPALELSSTVAWTGESAIQVGQKLLIHAKERDGSLFTLGFPWGQTEGDGYKFQTMEWCGFALPQNLENNFSIETLRAELQESPLVDHRENFLQYGYESESECRPNIQPTVEVSPDMGN